MTSVESVSLPAFTEPEYQRAKPLLAAKVASMMGRKLEEGDWTWVYCRAKGIPMATWSNLYIDVSCNGLGVEHKLQRVGLGNRPMKSVCGTTLMHPAATRSIRIGNTDLDPTTVMHDVFAQYRQVIESRQDRVREEAEEVEPDMRTGWLLWESTLTEFLYFEQRMAPPQPEDFYAEWNETPARGARKASKSLWVFDRETHQKRYSVTTSAGVKIQPYYDVPPPSDKNLYYFRVQSELLDANTVQIWVTASTARAIQRLLGGLDKETVSRAILEAAPDVRAEDTPAPIDVEPATPILLSLAASEVLKSTWAGVSDEHRAQLLLESLLGERHI